MKKLKGAAAKQSNAHIKKKIKQKEEDDQRKNEIVRFYL